MIAALLLAVVLAGTACAPAPEGDARAAVAPPKCTAPAVSTTSGKVCGLRQTGRGPDGGPRAVHAYLGIRYATAPRWERPLPFRSDDPTRATMPGKVCPQSTTWTDAEVQDEDCLFLNVWTPAERGPDLQPVMVFLHGGAFVLGAGSVPISDGHNLAARGNVVVVSLNYRLGALGFLAGGNGADWLEGNYGIRDQQMALRWVRANVREFGGDPAAVTLFGESAGAMSVGVHLGAPTSQSLFRAAIMQSNPYGIPFKSPAEAGETHRAFGIATETCLTGDLACLRQLPARRIVEAQESAIVRIVPLLLQRLAGFLAWTPVVDGDLIPTQARSVWAARPIMAGTNADEGVLFIGGMRSLWDWEYHLALRFLFGSAAAARILAHPRYAGGGGDLAALEQVAGDALFTCATRQVLARATSANVYGYKFVAMPSYAVWPPGFPMSAACQPSNRRVCHTFELPFVFGNPVTALSPTAGNPFDVYHRFTAAEQRLSDAMSSYWTTFARRLDPNRGDLPSWPRFRDGGVRLVLADAFSQTRDAEANCESLWDEIRPLGVRTRGG